MVLTCGYGDARHFSFGVSRDMLGDGGGGLMSEVSRSVT